MEKEKTLYTLIVHSENLAGVLSQITAVFTRRQVNIESLNVSASSIKGVHKYTITAWSDESTIIKITKQIEKKIDVIQAHYFTDKQIYIQEAALFKISTPVVLENSAISKTIRQHDANIVEVNPNYTIVSMSGMTEEIMSLYSQLSEYDCVLQYTRSGRIVITQDCIERVNEYLDERQRRYMDEKENRGI